MRNIFSKGVNLGSLKHLHCKEGSFSNKYFKVQLLGCSNKLVVWIMKWLEPEETMLAIKQTVVF